MNDTKYIQMSLFNTNMKNTSKEFNLNIVSMELYNKFEQYSLDKYIKDVESDGLEITWNTICDYVIQYGQKDDLINVKNFGELYELGLAIQDKIQKKKSGQYYTPDDVALVMGKWLDKCEGKNICDVACGTGKLIFTYLDYIGFNKAREILSDGKLYLYDIDKVALKICKTALLVKYGLDLNDKIHDFCGDFLNKDLILPKDCKTISNPPYTAISTYGDNWENSDVIRESRELYSSFMEKIIKQSKSTVIITPFSFISGKKFYSLRKKMCEIGKGFVVAFDNVPGNIFCGRKHGIFNTNTANSVRAAITVMSADDTVKGFRISPMIRFKNEERSKLFNCDILEGTLSDELQMVNEKNTTFKKVAKPLKKVFDIWLEKSSFSVKDFVTKDQTGFLIDMPNTCRYNTTASSKKLSRTGSIIMNIKDEEKFNFLYCFINSSFAYWWWRIYDGGITYPLGLLNKMPLPFNLLSEDDKLFFKMIANEMIQMENSYIVIKVNAGVKQENIKFPESYKNRINERLLNILNINLDSSIFKMVHDNKFFEE